MRILFLCHYFPPEVNAPATRTYEHCKEWVKRGHQVTVITCAPNHPRGQVYKGYKNKLFQVEEHDGIKVVRVWTYLAANKGFAKRTLNYFSFLISSLIVSIRLPRPDVVISTSPQFFCGLAGYPIKLIKRCSWVLEIRDLWPDSILAVGATKNPFIIKILRWLENFVYKKSDRIVVVTDAFKNYMLNLSIPEKKIDVIKNGVDLDFFSIMSKNTTYKESLGVDKEAFVAAYVGTHGMAHHLQTVLYAAEILAKHEHNIHFLLVGDGAERQNLLNLQKKLGLKNISLLPQQPKSDMPKIWSITDASLVLLKRSDLFKTVIPSKIFESMAMQKTILLGVEGESKEIIEESNSGICIEPENAKMLASKILMLFEDKSIGEMHGVSGRKYVEQFHNRAVLAARYEHSMRKAIDTKKMNIKQSFQNQG